METYNNIKPVIAIKSGSSSSDTTAIVGELIDRENFESCTIVLETGTIADADATFTVKLEHGDRSDFSDKAEVASGDVIGSLLTEGFKFSDDDTVFKLGYKGGKRYLKMTITPVNNSGAAGVSAIAILSNSNKYPIA